MILPRKDAEDILRAEAANATTLPLDGKWVAHVERLSQLCKQGKASTHIAFLGTSMLAKAVNERVDLYAIKPTHADENPNAYSARSLCHAVLVPVAAELGISIGVTGREPLNNQPYFRMTRLGDGTPVHPGGRDAFECMLGLVGAIQAMRTKDDARAALRAFIAVRRKYQPHYAVNTGEVSATPDTLAACVAELVSEDSEGGARAQAAVAGLFDVVSGTARVESGRINDPSRKYPGDVCVRGTGDEWAKAIEVRDKNVRAADVHIFCTKCLTMGVRDAALVMASSTQEQLDDRALEMWAATKGLGLTLFYGLPALVNQALFWAPIPKPDATLRAVETIEARLIGVEASPEAITSWHRLTRT